MPNLPKVYAAMNIVELTFEHVCTISLQFLQSALSNGKSPPNLFYFELLVVTHSKFLCFTDLLQ